MSVLLLLISGMVLIVLAADYFTNGIEWLGFLAHINEGATGSLLAAMGTALPETLVPVAAIYFGGSKPQTAIGLGAILGAPMMLATLGFFVIGVGLWSARRTHLAIPEGQAALRKDLKFFLLAFGVAISATIVPVRFHLGFAILLLIMYGLHARGILRPASAATTQMQPPERSLHLMPRRDPGLLMVLLQVAMALLGLIFGAHFFVLGLDQVTSKVHISEFLLSVLVTPVATELPEVFNSVIWIRRGRDSLAVGNVTGAMAFQASVVPALGMVVTRWQLSVPELATAAVAWIGALWILWAVRRNTLNVGHVWVSAGIYLGFLGTVLFLLPGR